MARSINKVELMGNLGGDPEVKTSNGGSARCVFNLATSHQIKDKDSGEFSDKTDWHRVVCFGRLAENVEKRCQKGSQVLIQGRLQTRFWDDENGKRNYVTEVVAQDMTFMRNLRSTEPVAATVADDGDVGEGEELPDELK